MFDPDPVVVTVEPTDPRPSITGPDGRRAVLTMRKRTKADATKAAETMIAEWLGKEREFRQILCLHEQEWRDAPFA